jgi:hypothetical protein
MLQDPILVLLLRHNCQGQAFTLLFGGTYTRSVSIGEVQVKAGVKAFSITLGFATNKIVPDDSLAEGTIYIINNIPKTASTLPKALMLSAD